MGLFEVRLVKSAETEFRQVPFPHRRQINQALHKLKSSPTPPEAESVEKPYYRLCVHGWFVLYKADDSARTVAVLRIYK